jgi:hypothetical protein
MLRDTTKQGFPKYDIIHFVGQIEWRDGDPALKVSERPEAWLRASEIIAAADAARTRLFILHVPQRQLPEARGLAEAILSAAKPGILLVAAENPTVANLYFGDLYAGIVHNQDIEVAAPPTPPFPPGRDIDVHLYLGEGGGGLLRFDRWLAALRERAQRIIDETRSSAQRAPEILGFRNRAEPYLNRRRFEEFSVRLTDATRQLTSLQSSAEQTLTEINHQLDFAHESGGAGPLSKIPDLIAAIEAGAGEARSVYPQLESELDMTLRNTPRVLNGNFADPAVNLVLKADECLIADKEYDLLVDIGPRWSTIPTIVHGHSEFPEQALPPDPSGSVIDVLLLSEQWAPKAVSAKLWLPHLSGRSHPWAESGPSPKSGPVKLRIRSPKTDAAVAGILSAQGRLFLYYENNLLQSAVVRVSVVPGPNVLAPPGSPANTVDVDYILSGTFGDVAAKYARRNIRLSADDTSGSHPIRLNVTLNHDGPGTHRILVHGAEGLPPAWAAYDPAAGLDALREARKTIADCFWQRDEVGIPVRNKKGGLDERNGKDRDQFCRDLFCLAEVGNRLFIEMMHMLRPRAGDLDAIAWEKELRRRIDRTSVIQVSRIASVPTQYAFPWALLYEYPMPSPSDQWRWCDVISQEWSREGIRNQPIASACPFQDQPWHKKDVLCPFGFWGLKHIIEQPLALTKLDETALRDGLKNIGLASTEVSLSIGWTRDATLDLARIDSHIRKLSGRGGMQLAHPPPNPADDRATMEGILATSNVVYFMCHCAKDPGRNEPYLHLGPRDCCATNRMRTARQSG